ncbi:MAG: 2-isopropylmalate synthase [Candidatus Hydrogenedentes bacterium]|nr:2-isopropylmalate synthase [Candidatus Hydrogenedentota bacterium]
MSVDVRIFDTTLRDGEQTPGVHVPSHHKVEIARMLEAFGVSTIEAGFPASSPGDKAAVATVAQTVRGCEVAALARCIAADVDAACAAVQAAERPVVHVFLGVSDIHLSRKLRMNRAQAIRAIEGCVSRARARVSTVQFSAEDATRTERVFLRQCVEAALNSGATRINVPDTVGCALPHEYAALIRDIVRFVDGAAIVSAHCHDDMGLATANTIAAIEAGAQQVEVTVNGIGERAGNAAAEQVGVVCAMKGVAHTGLDLTRIAELSRRVAEVTGVPVQPNRAVIGANAFAHSSGIHQDGIIKEAASYEFVPPSLVGVPGHTFVLTASSGRRAIEYKAREMGFDLPGNAADAVYREFIVVAQNRCGAVSDADLADIIRRTVGVTVA